MRAICRGLAGVLFGTITLVATGAPVANLASLTEGASITGPVNCSGSRGKPPVAVDGEITDYGPSRGYMWAYLKTPLVVRFRQPVAINAVEMLLLDVDDRDYGYVIETSAADGQWQPAVDRTRARDRSWQTHRFKTRTAQSLRIRFTRTSVRVGSYHVVELAAYSLPTDVVKTPLRQAWEERRAIALLSDIQLLGVERAQALLQQPGFAKTAQALRAGQVIRRDTDGDGDPDMLVSRGRAGVVVAIDDDDDMTAGADSDDGVDDCLAVDLGGDGRIDRSVDYTDSDGNGYADIMVQTYVSGSPWRRRALVLIRDLEERGPKRLWHLTSQYGYNQGQCQWHCDFGGDGYFVMFGWDPRKTEWTGRWENPFCFYDPDEDGLAEETVRISGTGRRLRSARYGMNADNDAPKGEDYDYDFSVTTLGSIEPAANEFTQFALRTGRKTGEYLKWERTRQVVRALPWKRALLVWDENDHNVAVGRGSPERWEGIINAAYRTFPQEGGPHCGTVNKRYELDSDFSGRMQLYYWPADRRLHLFGAEQGTMTVDYDHDGKPDLTVEYRDTDRDGFFDEREITTRRPKHRRKAGAATPASQVMPLDFSVVSAPWSKALADTLAAQAEMLAALAAVRGQAELPRGPMVFFRAATAKQFRGADAMRESAEARRFYQDVEIELSLAGLLEVRAPSLPQRAQRTQRKELEHEGPIKSEPSSLPVSVRSVSSVVSVPISNAKSLEPDLRKKGRQPSAAAVQRARELVDRGRLRAAATALREDPPADARTEPVTFHPAPAGTTFAMVGAKITAGWESDVVAYRAYWGKIDLFGKTDSAPRLAQFDAPGVDYHRDLGWGMDVLHVGRTSGLGGLNIWHEGSKIQVQWGKANDPSVPIEYDVRRAGPDVAEVLMLTRRWDAPCGRLDIVRRFTIRSGQRHTVEELEIHSTGSETLEFGPGLTIPRGGQTRVSAEKGYVATWGDQGIGAGPVGLAVVFDPVLCRRIEAAPEEQFVHLSAAGPRIRTHLLLAGTWAKAGRITSADAWFRYVEGLAKTLPDAEKK